MHDGVIYMALCERNYPVKLANSYLEELRSGFQEVKVICSSTLTNEIKELKSHYGTQSIDYRSKIETIEEPYHFLKFGKAGSGYQFSNFA